MFHHPPPTCSSKDVSGAVSPRVMRNKLSLNNSGDNPLKRRNWYMQVSEQSFRHMEEVGGWSLLLLFSR